MTNLLRSVLLTAACVVVAAPLVTDARDGPPIHRAVTSAGIVALDGGYYLWNYCCSDGGDAHVSLRVTWTSTYELEDGTDIGSDEGAWEGIADHASDLGDAYAAAFGWSVGWAIGWNAGGWIASWMTSQIAIGATVGWQAFGLGALVAGPWVGAFALASVGLL